MRADRLSGTGRDLHRGRPARGARRGRRVRAAAHGDDPRRDPRGGAAAKPSGRWSRSRTRSRARCGSTLDTLAFDAAGGDDRRRARLRRARTPDRRRATRAGADRGCALPPPAPRPVRPLPARAACPAPSSAASSSTAEAVRMVGESGAPGRRSARGRRPSSTAARSCARASRTSRTTSPASSGSRPAGTEPSGAGALEDLAGLLRAGRRPPRRPGRRAARVLQPRGQPEPDRVAAAAPADWAATCSSATSRGPSSEPAGRRGR